MTPEIRANILMSRVTHYLHIMRTTIFSLIGLAAVIELGPGGYSAPLTMAVVATVAFGVLAGGAALEDMNNMREDMDEAMAQSGYGKGLAARNLPMLKNVSSVLLLLIGLAELYAIFT